MCLIVCRFHPPVAALTHEHLAVEHSFQRAEARKGIVDDSQGCIIHSWRQKKILPLSLSKRLEEARRIAQEDPKSTNEVQEKPQEVNQGLPDASIKRYVRARARASCVKTTVATKSCSF